LQLADPRNEKGWDVRFRDMHFQVTAATSDQRFWKNLGTTGRASKEVGSTGEAADELLNAVRSKADRANSDYFLLLDAEETGFLSLYPVVHAFRQRWTLPGESPGGGWKGIWVVGPSANLTRRLDRPADEPPY